MGGTFPLGESMRGGEDGLRMGQTRRTLVTLDQLWSRLTWSVVAGARTVANPGSAEVAPDRFLVSLDALTGNGTNPCRPREGPARRGCGQCNPPAGETYP